MENDKTVHKVKLALLAMQRHSWEQGVAAQAFLEMGEADLVVLMAKEAVLRQREDGRLGVVGSDGAVTDPAANGEAVLYAARLTGDPALHAAGERMLGYLLHEAPRTADGTLHHLTTRPQVWVDSMYMAPPFIAVAGHPQEAVRQIEGFRKLLWQPEKRLFAHQWDDGLQSFERAAAWGVGNGWAAAGMARVIRALPALKMAVGRNAIPPYVRHSHPLECRDQPGMATALQSMGEERARLVGYVEELLDGCLAHQRRDGLFHDVVDDPTTFVETNLAQMLAYTIYRGTGEGWLDASYRPHADRMRHAAHEQVDEFGLVQGVCGAPRFDRPGTAPEGQAFFLLMEAAYSDML